MKKNQITMYFALAIGLLFLSLPSAWADDAIKLKAVHLNESDYLWVVDLIVENNKISGTLSVDWPEREAEIEYIASCRKAKVKKGNKFKTWCGSRGIIVKRSLRGDFTQAKLAAQGDGGGASFRFVTGEDLKEFLAKYQKDQSNTTDKYLSEKQNQ
jgi:hypothetical protein